MATSTSTNDTSTSGLFINLTTAIWKTRTELKPTTFLPLIEREDPVVQLLNFNHTNYTVGNNSLEDLASLCDEVSMDSQTAKVTQTAVYCLIMLLSLCGNSFLIAIFFKNPNMRSPIHHLITNMAISDLLVSVFVLPMRISEIEAGATGRWLVGGTFGSFLCKLSPFMSDISTAVSIESLVLVAVDRSFAVNSPLSKPLFTTGRTRVVIGLTWLVAAVVHSPYFYVFVVRTFNNHFHCLPDWMPLGKNALKHFYLVVFSFLFAVPVVFIIIMYSAIARELNRKPADCRVFCAAERRQRKRENMKVIKMMVVVVVVFVVSYAPSHFLIFCNLYAPLLLRCNKPLFHAIVRIMVHCNGAANPLIYFIISKNYRLAAKALFESKRRRLLTNSRTFADSSC